MDQIFHFDNFPEKISSKEKANEILAEWNDEITTTLETFGNKLIKIENNPGFLGFGIFVDGFA